MISPPLLVNLASTLRSHVEWEYIPEGWAYAATHPRIKGWNVADVLETQKRKWPQFVAKVQGKGPLGTAHESAMTTDEDIKSHNTTMTFAYVLALSAHQRESFSMLDWGGGIGHYCLLAQMLLPDVKIDYHCKDVPLLAEHGAQLFPDQHFYADESCLARSYDLVLASTSLQYSEDWRTLLGRLANTARGYLYIANLPIVKHATSFVFVQRAYRYGYNTEYLAWCLNRVEFLKAAECAGLDLLREFVYGYQPLIRGAPEQNVYRGYLFRTSLRRKA